MVKHVLSIPTLLFVVVIQAAADDIRLRQHPYVYGDAVSAMAADAFVACSDCPVDKLQKLPKQIISIRMPSEMPSAIQPVQISQDLQPMIADSRQPQKKISSLSLDRNFGDVRFQFGKDELQQAELLKLDKIITSLPPAAQLTVAGYTCTTGSKEYNLDLSERRAKNVAAYLRKSGALVMNVAGYGDCCAVSQVKAANRRVEIIKKRESKND